MITIDNLPIPPSTNSAYATVRIKGRLRRVSSKGLSHFKILMARHKIANASEFSAHKALIASWLNDGQYLEVQATFHFERSQLFTLKNEPKKMDTSNRIKAIEDSLADLLDYDDSVCFKISAEKVLADGKEKATIRICPIKLP